MVVEEEKVEIPIFSRKPGQFPAWKLLSRRKGVWYRGFNPWSGATEHSRGGAERSQGQHSPSSIGEDLGKRSYAPLSVHEGDKQPSFLAELV
ncbi:MAG: hypothetical protein DDT35_01360 [Firmicutes bacterium]|nr:hypothetical protein [Bacillota bacterium]